MHPHTLANLFAKSIARYTLVTKRTCSPRVVGYRQSMLQHATDLEGFAPQTSDQGSPLDSISLRRFETQVSKLPALAGRQEQTVVCSMPRGFGCCEVVNPNWFLILPSVRYHQFGLTTATLYRSLLAITKTKRVAIKLLLKLSLFSQPIFSSTH